MFFDSYCASIDLSEKWCSRWCWHDDTRTKAHMHAETDTHTRIHMSISAPPTRTRWYSEARASPLRTRALLIHNTALQKSWRRFSVGTVFITRLVSRSDWCSFGVRIRRGVGCGCGTKKIDKCEWSQGCCTVLRDKHARRRGVRSHLSTA